MDAKIPTHKNNLSADKTVDTKATVKLVVTADNGFPVWQMSILSYIIVGCCGHVNMALQLPSTVGWMMKPDAAA